MLFSTRCVVNLYLVESHVDAADVRHPEADAVGIVHLRHEIDTVERTLALRDVRAIAISIAKRAIRHLLAVRTYQIQAKLVARERWIAVDTNRLDRRLHR